MRYLLQEIKYYMFTFQSTLFHCTSDIHVSLILSMLGVSILFLINMSAGYFTYVLSFAT